jgi:hypothetical protein
MKTWHGNLKIIKQNIQQTDRQTGPAMHIHSLSELYNAQLYVMPNVSMRV